MARAAAAAPPTRRSQLFLFVAAEEQGLLGSEWYARHPTFAPGRIAANLNLDSVNKDGRTRDVGVIGLGKSSLDEVVVAVAGAQGRTVNPDPFPDRGSFYRSDQFNFARIGVPAVYASGGPTYVGRPPGWGKQREDDFNEHHYHQPSDEYDGSWDLSGAIEDAALYLVVGTRVANATALPTWTPGDEFEAARKATKR
jgi:Zn-dependent M28 family amino/carboxypeptidase